MASSQATAAQKGKNLASASSSRGPAPPGAPSGPPARETAPEGALRLEEVARARSSRPLTGRRRWTAVDEVSATPKKRRLLMVGDVATAAAAPQEAPTAGPEVERTSCPPRAPGVDAGAGARPSPRAIPEAGVLEGGASGSRRGASASVEAWAALEAQLAAENVAAEEERARLAEAWALLRERAEVCRLRDASAQAAREAAMKLVQETCASAQRVARLEMGQLEAARVPPQTDAASWQQEMEARAADLDRRETGLAQLAGREAELLRREAEVLRREEQAQLLEEDQAAREEQLSAREEQVNAREEQVATAEASYDARVAKANASLEERQKRQEDAAAEKIKLAKEAFHREFQEKTKKQEERFKAKRDKLQFRIDGLEKAEKEMLRLLERAQQARKDAEARSTALAADLEDLQLQVAPAASLAEQAQDNAQHSQQMSRQRQSMLQDLVRRARNVAYILGVQAPRFAPGDDEASYTFFFEEFLRKLEEVAAELDNRVTESSRELLLVATGRIFCNLVRLHPAIDLDGVMAPTVFTHDRACAAARAYARRFEQVEVAVDDEGDEEDAEEGDAAASEGTS